MSTRESNAFQRLKTRVCRPEDRFQRVENGIGSGWPDSNYCFAGREGWIEIKAPRVPAREDTALLANSEPLNLEQSNWALAQSNAGGRVFLFVATEVMLMLIGCNLMIEYKKLNAMSLAAMAKLAVWKTPVPVQDPTVWVTLRGILCGKV